MYASAMLRLHRECGKEEWLGRFYRALGKCPPVKARRKDGGLRQSLHWWAAASLAARRDLTPIFCDEWRLPLARKARSAAAALDWTKRELTIEEVLAAVPAEFEP